MAKILLLSLEVSLAEDLYCKLTQLLHQVQLAVADQLSTDHIDADVIFLAGDGPHFRDSFNALRSKRPDLPLVVVTRLPEVTVWLDALEAGAADYCAAPFEQQQIRWILEATLRQRHSAAA